MRKKGAFILIVLFSLAIWVWGNFFIKNNTFIRLKVGQKWEEIFNKDNPYKKSDTIYYIIIDIKGDYAKYLEIHNGDTTIRSSRKNIIKWNTKLIK